MSESANPPAATADWDPRSPEVLENQQAACDEMRERCPVARSDYFGWSLFKYDDVIAVARDSENFGHGTESLEQIEAAEKQGQLVGIPLGLDPPVHATYRMMLNPHFSLKRMKEFEPTSRAVAIQVLEPILTAGAADMVAEFSEPYTVKSLCALLGWDPNDWQQIKDWSVQGDRAAVNRDDAAAAKVREAWRGYIMGVMDERRKAPRSDITSWLLDQQAQGAPLTNDRIFAIVRLLLQAGHGTTSNSISLCLLHLAQDQALQSRLRAEPDAIPRAIEEILRADGPLVSMRRTAKRDVEIRGRLIKAGENVQMTYISADRDPDVFPEPDKIDIDRKQNRHLIWGSGIHTCLGMPLAKMELRVALEEILARTKSFRLQPDAVVRRFRYPGNSPRALPMIVEAA